MDDLITQLRELGAASESTVRPVSPIQARTRVVGTPATEVRISAARNTEIPVNADLVPPGSASTRPSARRVFSARAMAIAAALAIIVGSIALVQRNDAERPIEITSAILHQDRFAVPDDNGWAQLRECESNAIYDSDTGNTFYGAYQLTRSTWRSTTLALGLGAYVTTNPADAPPYIQDAVANAAYLEHGLDLWPICGRFVQGSMITPVIPQWFGQQRSEQRMTRIFLEPDADADLVAAATAAATALIGADADEIDFMDKEAAFAQFQAMFQHDEQIRGSVIADDMPASLQITAAFSAGQLTELRAIPGVFEVVQDLGFVDTATDAPMRLSIPAIGVETPIYTAPTVDGLAQGPVILMNDASALAVGGYGSVEGSVFSRLGQLRAGDLIIVTSLITEDQTSLELTRTFTVPAAPDALSVVDLEEAFVPRASDRQGLTLVADVGDDARRRLLVRTEIAGPDLGLYATEE